MAYSELFDWSEEMVTAALEAVSVACKLALDPTVTLPKLRFEGLIPSCEAALSTPVPARSIVRSGFLAVLTSLTEPTVCPGAVGAKITVK